MKDYFIRQEISVSTPDGGVIIGLSAPTNSYIEGDEPFVYLANGYHFRSVTQLQSNLIVLESRIQADPQLASLKEYTGLVDHAQSLLSTSVQDPGQITETETEAKRKLRELRESVETVADGQELGSSSSKLSQELIDTANSIERMLYESSEPRILTTNFSGTITDIPINNGDTVLPGALLARIQLEPATIEAYLSSEDVERIHIADVVDICCFPENMTGTIMRIGKTMATLPEILAGNPYNSSKGIPVTIHPDNPIQWPTGIAVEISPR